MKNFLSQRKSAAIKFAVAAGICFTSLAQAQAAEFPSYFDWRLNNHTDSDSGFDNLSIISPIENQYPYGTCWSYGTYGSYESSWMKQLLAAQAAGYNVDVSRVLFSKEYTAWLAHMPATNNSSDNSAYYELGGDDIDLDKPKTDRHPNYDQGGNVAKSTSTMVRYGAIDKNDVVMANTEALQSQVTDEMDTAQTWNKLTEFAKKYLVIRFVNGVNKAQYDLTGIEMTDSEKEALGDRYEKTLTTELIEATATQAYNNTVEDAIMVAPAPKGLLHDTYTTKEWAIDKTYGLTDEQLEKTKELIQTEGAVVVSHKSSDNEDYSATYNRTGEVYPFETGTNHMETLVGWSDDYIFQNYSQKDGSPLRGSFIMRNSWGTDAANRGYGYLAYDDTSIGAIAFYNAELDSKRYTINSNLAPAPDTIDWIEGAGNYGTQNIANTYTATTDSGEFLKAVMFYASEDNMPYEIVIREGSTPGTGTILTQQSGTFGSDGSAKWAGYRTVDLNKYVFLAKDKDYVVEVRTTSPEGKTVYVAMMASQKVENDGESYYYDEDLKEWIKTDKMVEENDNSSSSTSLKAGAKADGDSDSSYPMGYDQQDLDKSDYKQVFFFNVARGKESSEANGGDFTVSWLDDTNSDGNSVINLGSASELYEADYLNPNRTTLSNMTVDLNSGVYNFYRGSIIGEGSVTKTGAGFLALTGTNNTYTGGTFVNNGRLEIDGSIAGDATTTDNGIISGSGLIGGTLYNRNKAFAGNLVGYGNLTMGNLESSGELIAQNPNTKFVVNGEANVEGATVTARNVLPDETVEVVEAQSISGNLKNSSTPSAISGLLSSTAKVSDNKVSATAQVANNLGDVDDVQAQTFNAVRNISNNLKNDSRKGELYQLVNFDATNAKNALSEIGSTDSAQMFSAAQQSTVANRIISDRLTTAFSAKDFDVEVGANRFADDNENSLVLPMSVTAPMQVENNVWIKFTKNWGELKGGADYHGQAISGGYDRAFGQNWRGGVFVSYSATGLGATNSSGNIYDTRFGIYAGYHKNADDAFIYVDGGKIRNKLYRNLNSLGLQTEAKYNGTIFEIGGEYKHDLQPERTWHVSPFINLQLSSLKQNSYSETGAGIFNQHVNSKRNTYFAGQLGVEFKRVFTRGNYAARLGIKHAFSGADPELSFSYEGDANNFYNMKNSQDKTHFVMSISGENEFAKDWILGGDIMFQKGSNDRDLSASVMLRKLW